MTEWIRVRGASEHNLKHVSVDLPRQALNVFTGVSGSGKSSLAFDTIFREGQRRFLESLPAYARYFLDAMERPDVEWIEGLSPAVSIDQKTVSRNPRSTVGTITEVYDYLRLLYARAGEPHCPRCERPVSSQGPDQIVLRLLHAAPGRRVLVCAPLVRDRRGEHRSELEALRRDGLRRLILDGELVTMSDAPLDIDGRSRHSIDIVYDRLVVGGDTRARLAEAVENCIAIGDGRVAIHELDDSGAPRLVETYSSRYACPDCGIDLPELEPRLFSFNSAHGKCPGCDGLGRVERIDPDALVANPSLPFANGGLDFMTRRGVFANRDLDDAGFARLGERLGFTIRSSWSDLDEDARRAVLHGDGIDYRGWVPVLTQALDAGDKWVSPYARVLDCESCDGERLAPAARSVRVSGRTITNVSGLPLSELESWLAGLELDETASAIAAPIRRDLAVRLRYLRDVGLGYLSTSRRAATLSGGESQRLRLASQLGAGLQGVLYVLDEPSIGLHPRDHERLLETLGALRDLGNTLIVVEHDRDTMARADHLVDVGPGAGRGGGEIVAAGTFETVAAEARSITGRYLSGEAEIPIPSDRRGPSEASLEIYGAAENNLREIDVTIPLERFVAVTGVSGSGKSSLVLGILHRALRARLGSRTTIGRHRSLKGYSNIDKVILIDQAPIGRSPRSNPATYVKAFGLIRDLFALVPEARARGYKAGRFSFNKDGGRCLECGGAGVQVADLQLLASVEIECDACAGRRYNRETLEILYRGKSIADVLSLTIAEALEFFADHPKIRRALEPLRAVGLDYVQLGQPATTLSGGEAQRIKLAAELRRRATGRTLYVLDEPTTGLHFEDIQRLLDALQALVDRKNSVIVIEHNLDVIKVADHVIDLGPGAGDRGGSVVATGTPEEVARVDASHTGAYLRAVLSGDESRAAKKRGLTTENAPPAEGLAGDLVVTGASEHNLKGVDVTIPRGRLTVVTGVSGSGKTSLALDTIFAEGQRRYIESLSTYARRFLGQMHSPAIERIQGLSPAIAIDQQSVRANPRSTVATITEIYDFVRILFARIGTPECPDCAEALDWTSPTRLAATLVEEEGGERLYVLAPTSGWDDGAESGGQLDDVRRWITVLVKSGFTRVIAGGEEVRLDEEGDRPARRLLAAVRSDAEREGGASTDPLCIVVDRVVAGERAQSRLASSLESAFEHGRGRAAVRVGDRAPAMYTTVPTCRRCGFVLEREVTPRSFSFNSHQGCCERCGGLGRENRVDPDRAVPWGTKTLPDALDPVYSKFLEHFRPAVLRALRAILEARDLTQVSFAEYSHADRAAVLYGEGTETVSLPIESGSVVDVTWEGLVGSLERWERLGTLGDAASALRGLFVEGVCSACGGGRLRPEFLAVRIRGKNVWDFTAMTISDAREFLSALELSPRDAKVVEQVLDELRGRLRFLADVGLDYLTLDRTADTLSGGEAQRIRLASQLGSRLSGVLYVLDEPTVGLHPADTERLLATLEELRSLGNTVLVVEHDADVMRRADHLIELGPGAGYRGGEVVAAGTPDDVIRDASSSTARFLRAEESAVRRVERGPAEAQFSIRGARLHNLRDVSIDIPRQRFTVVAGVSGSGKSSLVLDVFAASVARNLPRPETGGARVDGLEGILRLCVVDQNPIGRSPRSNPATYTGVWDRVREFYAGLPLARVKGFNASRFSFNVPAGRCVACEGLGVRFIDMQFLSDVWVKCEVCRGKRYDSETLAVRYRGKSIGDVLDLEVDEAAELFSEHPACRRILGCLQEVGLGYVKLGQPATTLSGGEAQRVKLAAELSNRSRREGVFVLDEPTTGLHFEDVRALLDVLQALVDRGQTVVVIEHNLDVIASADWVIDLGPGAGEEGGRIVAYGPPAEIARSEGSRTGECLRRVFDAAAARSGAP